MKLTGFGLCICLFPNFIVLSELFMLCNVISRSCLFFYRLIFSILLGFSAISLTMSLACVLLMSNAYQWQSVLGFSVKASLILRCQRFVLFHQTSHACDMTLRFSDNVCVVSETETRDRHVSLYLQCMFGG